MANKKAIRLPDNVLPIQKPFYITCNQHCFMLKEAKNLIDKNGNKIPDPTLYYAGDLCGIIRVAFKHEISVPMDIQALGEKLQEIYDRLDEKFPKEITAKEVVEGVRKEK